ncbi:hypothetical protein GWK47_031841 [Chionoecetes opilio]|uniref:Uncharacterized protein n=1 Tax=Chionoecetes opilio TaxID=41210 RepID=A0A8J5CQE8_CHIOP|nr:hypothetical protein GWK47_031841 [Chionoecetes opilio]
MQVLLWGRQSTGSGPPLTCPEDGPNRAIKRSSCLIIYQVGPTKGHHGHQAGPGPPRLHSRGRLSYTTDNGANYLGPSATMAQGLGGRGGRTNPDVGEVINSPEDQEEQEREGLDIISVTMALAGSSCICRTPPAAQASKMQASKSKRAHCQLGGVHSLSPKFTTGTMGGPPPLQDPSQGPGPVEPTEQVLHISHTIKQVVGRKLPTPVVTRWNSLYDACSCCCSASGTMTPAWKQ